MRNVGLNGLYFIIPAEKLRETPNVLFNKVPVVDNIRSIDYVKHGQNAKSPSINGKENEKFWYMHPYQDDNLLVITGTRFIQLYSVAHGKVENFEATSEYLKHDGKIIHQGMCIFGWPRHVFHRIDSGPEGSNSINYAQYHDDFDPSYNFNIFTLNTETGEYLVAREGHEDQKFNVK